MKGKGKGKEFNKGFGLAGGNISLKIYQKSLLWLWFEDIRDKFYTKHWTKPVRWVDIFHALKKYIKK